MTNFHQLMVLTLCVLLVGGCTHCEHAKGSKSRHTFDFEKLDIDADGKISKQEFLDSITYSSPPEQLFNQLDSDSDGYLSKSELNSIKRRRRHG
ncbi:EF-hand domain-containing protein [Shewanella sp. UCD-KL12]|uniref:EF-hand domain-containing protein n=1 Tax=Shewanella sp. UCD-KL12 TaxID=1917163 RepID=UPI0009713984|nr:hypothetical protein [Shewanella sp. UCD-KL12]